MPEEKALQEGGDRTDLEGHAGHLKIGEMGEFLNQSKVEAACLGQFTKLLLACKCL